ncbi:hypothetical protein PACTADRAFT_86876 [Pachysolen tannophilus NRRL Y-2460]|uniref:SPIN90/Ldb17 leucine-rich domain-containing protein n=1 Tax=Pachysolen tannophilus NRRL Y-2460 TaxID=669874 RepID=A0A1E4TPZ0_PACTA|nr:hypothetical protein PACTADRAFT_86876 [Pachysolen tannophilus NRRL Y-2460]
MEVGSCVDDEATFWASLNELIKGDNDQEEEALNKRLVSCLSLVSKHTLKNKVDTDTDCDRGNADEEYGGEDLDLKDFEFYYKVSKLMISDKCYARNLEFVIRKLLTLLLKIDDNTTSLIDINKTPAVDDVSVVFIRENNNFIKVISYLLLINYKFNPSVLSILQKFQGLNIICAILLHNHQRSKVYELNAQHHIYKNLMELLYEFLENIKLSVEELNSLDENFINYLFQTIKGVTREEDRLNFYKFRIILILNEQYMVGCYENNNKEPSDIEICENKIFKMMMMQNEIFHSFCECLILSFNRDSENHILQILILKILYLIFTTSVTCQWFYLNDLKVLVDIFLRELNNLSISDNQTALINTYLRVLYPMLLFSQLNTSNFYKKKYLIELISSISNEVNDNENIQNDEINVTRRLILRFFDFFKKLKREEIGESDASSESSSRHSSISSSDKSVLTNINGLNSKQQLRIEESNMTSTSTYTPTTTSTNILNNNTNNWDTSASLNKESPLRQKFSHIHRKLPPPPIPPRKLNNKTIPNNIYNRNSPNRSPTVPPRRVSTSPATGSPPVPPKRSPFNRTSSVPSIPLEKLEYQHMNHNSEIALKNVFDDRYET